MKRASGADGHTVYSHDQRRQAVSFRTVIFRRWASFSRPGDAGRENEKVPVLGEDNPPEFEGSLQELIVIPFSLSVLGHGQHIDLELPQASSNGRGNMMIHIKGEAHGDSPAVRSFALTRDGSCRDAIKSTSFN